MSSCKLVIKDQVNVKFENLDLKWRQRLHQKFKYQVPYAYHLPAVKLGRWDGTVSFFTQGGLTYVNLLHEIMTILEQNNYTFDLDDRREQLDLKFDPVNENTLDDITWPK